jgi:hypothetical protein
LPTIDALKLPSEAEVLSTSDSRMTRCRLNDRPCPLSGLFAGLAFVLCAGFLPQHSSAIEPMADPGADLDFVKDVRPLLEKYCFDCHSGSDPVGQMPIDNLDPAGGTILRKSWQKVHDNLESTLMPPDDAEQPSVEERKKIVAWLESHPLRIDCSGPTHPGRVTIRRLNRAEYNNTIRDLCGVDFKPAEDFPNDDVGYGFDNIGDVLSLPPILLEKYLDAAEKIAEKAILVPSDDNAPAQRGPGKNLASQGETSMEYDFPVTGEYILRARAAAEQAGPELAKMGFNLDRRQVTTFDVTGEHSTDWADYEFRTRVTQGKHRFSAGFLNDYYKPNDPDPKLKGDRNLYIEFIEISGPIGVKPTEFPDSHNQIIFVEPSKEKSADECAREIFNRFASRAYRRPATDDEVNRLMKLFAMTQEDGELFERGIQLGVQAVLVSPSFLFRVEQEPGPQDPDGIRTLTEYELATRLSYFLWSSMPDSELFALAYKGKLRENLDDQVRRMLKDPKADALVENFAGQWLELRALEITSPDPKQFPSWNQELREAMRKESELFFAYIMREDRSIVEFLDADYTFVNERLAKHYGLEGISGSQFQKVSVPADQRGGLLGHASILTVTSNPNRTSPVKRGKWVLENLLAAPPPPAPPNVPQLEEGRRRGERASLRQRLELHRSNPSCAACHRLLDPLGFGLENYDAIGAWRTMDGRFAIDPAGELPNGDKFEGVQDLRAVLRKREGDFRRCLAEKLMTYALGRGMELDDECTLRSIANEMAQKEDKFSALVLAIVHSEQFQKRASIRSKMD